MRWAYGIAGVVASTAVQGLLAGHLSAAEPKAVAKKMNVDAQVVAPGSRVAGKTIAEWGEAWWQWLLATPGVHDPALDQSGEKCHYGQSGPVWFLAGSYDSSKVFRRCMVPVGKYILFPAANGLLKPLPAHDVDCKYAIERVARGIDPVMAPFATLNGRTVPRMLDRRERTGACFDPALTGRKVSAADGYWVMLRPLPVGQHVLKFGNDESGPSRKDVTLALTVAPNVTLTRYENWPNPESSGVREMPNVPGGIAWEGASVIMPTTALFDDVVVLRRLIALITRDTRYTMVRQKPYAAGYGYWLSVAPRDVAAFDARSPEITRDFHSPVRIWTEPPRDGKVRIIAGSLVLHGPGRAHGLEASRDIQRFLWQALDKRIAVSDHDVLAAVNAMWPTWEDLTRHRPPVPERSAEQKAADRKFSQEVDARLARATEATRPAPGRVYLKAEYTGTARISPEGLRIEQCCASAFSVAKATRTYSYGKYYFEAELGMPPSRTAALTWTNLGIVYGNATAYGEEAAKVFEHGEARRFPAGTVVGVAVDLDEQLLYVHINGVWRTGEPGSSAGKLMSRARHYTAFFAVASPDGKDEESDTWTANFGASAFRYPLPAGYAPYDGQ